MEYLNLQLLPLTALAGYFYYAGGQSWGHTVIRDLGLPMMMALWFVTSGLFNWWLIPCFGLMYGAQTTYFKKKDTDATWLNWAFVGLAFSFCMLPYAIAVGNYWGFFWRTLVVTNFTIFWSILNGKVEIEESGRGAIQILTLPLLVF